MWPTCWRKDQAGNYEGVLYLCPRTAFGSEPQDENLQHLGSSGASCPVSSSECTLGREDQSRKGNGRVVAIRYLMNLGGGGEEEGDLSKASHFTCLPLHWFLLRLSHVAKRAEHTEDDRTSWYFIAFAPLPSLGLSVSSSGPKGTTKKLLPIPRCDSI